MCFITKNILNKRQEKLLVAIILICIATGSYFLYRLQVKREKSYSRYLSCEGTILNSQIADVNEKSTERIYRYWELKVSYEYKIDGVSYKGKNASPEKIREDYTDNGPSDDLKAYLNKFTPGSKVEIHYHPDFHEKSFLLYKKISGKYVLLGITIGLLLLALIPLYLFFKKKN